MTLLRIKQSTTNVGRSVRANLRRNKTKLPPLYLSKRDYNAVTNGLRHPAEPNEYLRETMDLHKRAVQKRS